MEAQALLEEHVEEAEVEVLYRSRKIYKAVPEVVAAVVEMLAEDEKELVSVQPLKFRALSLKVELSTKLLLGNCSDENVVLFNTVMKKNSNVSLVFEAR